MKKKVEILLARPNYDERERVPSPSLPSKTPQIQLAASQSCEVVLARSGNPLPSSKGGREKGTKNGKPQKKAVPKKDRQPVDTPLPPDPEEGEEAMEVEPVVSNLETNIGSDKQEMHQPSTGLDVEVLMSNVMRQVGDLVSARFEAIQARLMPEQHFRPPLKADNRSVPRNGSGTNRDARESKMFLEPPASRDTKGPVSTVSRLGEDKEIRPGKKKREKKGKTGDERQPRQKTPVPSLAPAAALSDTCVKTMRGTYAAAVKSGRENKIATTITAPITDGSFHTVRRRRNPVAGGTSKTVVPPQKSNKDGKAKPKKKGPSKRSAAVVISQLLSQEEPFSMAEVLQEARDKIDLSPLGIDYLRPKRAATGALILEVPGEGSASKAEALATKLEETLGPRARISRPVLQSEIRITGLDESATAAVLSAAIAKDGKCSAEEIRVGDRSGLCYRCGGEGHLAAKCSAAPHCIICNEKGRPAGHRLGGKACPVAMARDGKRRSRGGSRKVNQKNIPAEIKTAAGGKTNEGKMLVPGTSRLDGKNNQEKGKKKPQKTVTSRGKTLPRKEKTTPKETVREEGREEAMDLS